MGREVNKVILVGHVGQDPDVQETADGRKVAWFSLATKREGGERTDWHRMTASDRLAQFCEDYVEKGSRVYVEGRLHYDSYERDGITIPTADIVIRELVLLGSRAMARKK